VIRDNIYPVEEILPLLKDAPARRSEKEHIILNGIKVKTTSQRHAVFIKSTVCCACGIEGRFFAVERHIDTKSYHFNLYAYNKEGEEVLMTKDHIIPVSKGGKNEHSNYQTMCAECNRLKDNK